MEQNWSPPRFTVQERQVLAALVQGTPPERVALDMSIGRQTLVNHLRNVTEEVRIYMEMLEAMESDEPDEPA